MLALLLTKINNRNSLSAGMLYILTAQFDILRPYDDNYSITGCKIQIRAAEKLQTATLVFERNSSIITAFIATHFYQQKLMKVFELHRTRYN